MLQGLAKYVGGKVLTAVIAVTAAVILIWYWQLPPEAKHAIWDALRRALAWTAFAAVLPWATFFVPPLLVRAESNLVSALALLGYLLVDIVAALWLAGWSISSAMTWLVVLFGFGCAATYNFVVCEYLAGRAEEA